MGNCCVQQGAKDSPRAAAATASARPSPRAGCPTPSPAQYGRSAVTHRSFSVAGSCADLMSCATLPSCADGDDTVALGAHAAAPSAPAVVIVLEDLFPEQWVTAGTIRGLGERRPEEDGAGSSDPGLTSEEGSEQSTPATQPVPPPRRGPFAGAPRAAGLSCGAVGARAVPRVLRPWDADMLAPDALEHLARGGVLFSFSCTAARDLSAAERAAVGAATATAAPRPPPDFAAAPARDGVLILSRAAYLLPGARLGALSAPLIASVAYQRACAHSSMRIDAGKGGADSFRLTKTVIPVVFSVTVEYRCTEVAAADLPALSVAADGARLDRAFVLDDCRPGAGAPGGEYLRTVLMYKEVDGGVLFWSATVVARGSLPGVVVRVIDKVGANTADEIADIAGKMRSYWAQ